MAEPRDIVPADLDYWAEYDPQPTVFSTPEEIEYGVLPCPGIVTSVLDEGGRWVNVVRVPVVLNEIEVMHLAKGGTLWLSTWGGLPPWMIEVQDPNP